MNIQQTTHMLHLGNMILTKYSKIIRDINISEKMDWVFVEFFVLYPAGATIGTAHKYKATFDIRRRVIVNSLKLRGYVVTEYPNGLIRVS